MTFLLIVAAVAAVLLGIALAVTGFRRMRGDYGYSDGDLRRGLMSIAGGILLISGVYYISRNFETPAATIQAAPAGPSRAELDKLEAALKQSRTEKVAVITDLETIKAELQTAQNSLGIERKAHDEHLTSILGSVGLARKDIGGSAVSAIDAGPSDETTTEKHARILKHIADLGKLGASVARTVSADPDAMHDAMVLRDKMGVEMRTENYDVSLYPDNEVLEGKKGRYYVIDLKEAKSGIRYYFQPGRYTIDKRIPEFRSSLNNFAKDVLEKMHGKVDYQLLVRGSADKAPFSGKLELGHEYKEISFMKSVGDDRYASGLVNAAVRESVANEDLPNLRAAFLQQIIANAYPLKAPVILEGSVTPRHAEGDRNVELLLYVNW